MTRGSNTKLDVQELSEHIIGKRKSGGKVVAPNKRTRLPESLCLYASEEYWDRKVAGEYG